MPSALAPTSEPATVDPHDRGNRRAARRHYATLTVSVGATLLFVVLAAAGVAALVGSQKWVEHTHEVRVELESLESALLAAEASQRNFLLVPEKRYLDQMLESETEVRKRLETLQRLIGDNPRQRQRMPGLQRLITGRLDLLDRIVAIGREQGFDAAVAAIRVGQGIEYMAQVRVLIGQMQRDEGDLLDQRSDRVALVQAGLIMLLSAFGGLLALLQFTAFRNVIRHDANEHAARLEAESTAVTLSSALTDAVRVRHELQRSENRYRQLLDQMHDGVFVAQDFRFAYVNTSLASMLGRRPDDLIGRPFDAVVAPEDLAVCTERFRRRVAGDDVPNEYEVRLLRADGSRIVAMLRAERFEYEGRSAALGTLDDITKRKGAEQRLAESERQFRELVEGSVQGIYVHQDGMIRFANATLVHMAGFENASDLVGQRYDIIIPPEQREYFEQQRQQRLRGEPSFHQFEGEGIRRDGSRFWAQVAASRVIWQDAPAIMVAVVDITEAHEARRRLEAQERYYHSLIDNLQDIITVIDGAGTIAYSSPSVLAVLGRDAGLRAGQNVFEYVHPDDREKLAHAFRGALDHPGPQRPVEFRVRHADGSWRVLEATGASYQAPDAPTRVIVVSRDITERKRASDELAAKTAMIEATFAHMAQGVVAVDGNRRIIAWNRRLLELLDVPEELVRPGTDADDILRYCAKRGDYGPGDIEDLVRQRRELTYRPESHSFERPTPSGRVLEAKGAPMPGGGRVLTYTDVTAERKAAMALAESEARLRGIMDNTVDAIITIDESGIIGSANQAAVRMFGYGEGELIGRNVRMLMPEPDASRHDEYLAAYRRSGIRRVIGIGREVQGRRKDGREFPVDLAVGELAGPDGRRTFIGTLRDLTERKSIEEQLRQAQKMEAVGQLTGGVAHDFNNLLAVMTGNLELARERLEADVEGQELIDVALRAAQRGADLTYRLLAFSRRQTLLPAPTDVNELVRGMIGMLGRTLGETIEIRTTLADELPQAMVDAAQLESAILNLAVNARDAMPAGGRLAIETAAVDQDYASRNVDVHPGRYAMVAVTDTGVGMPPEVVERAFEPFFTTKEVGKGTGLGLSMVYGFAKQSGGHARIYSEVGHGTTVRLYLPVAPVTAEKASVPPDQSMARDIGAGRAILVVEDDNDLRVLAQQMLERLGFTVVAATDAYAGFDELTAHPEISILLTDVVLPKGKSGVDLANEARAATPDLKVVFMSGYAEGALAGRAPAPPNCLMLRKPFTRRDLAAVLRKALEPADG